LQRLEFQRQFMARWVRSRYCAPPLHGVAERCRRLQEVAKQEPDAMSSPVSS
jgi:hypothetical protein